MATEKQEKHRSGPLKQQNKSHKHGRHRTKGQIEINNKGRVDLKSLTKKNKSLDKQQRRHQAKQIRKNQRDATLDQKRGLGTTSSAPHVIVIFPLSISCDAQNALEYLIGSDDSIVTFRNGCTTTIVSTRHKQRFTILQPEAGNLQAMLQAGKVADTFLFLTTTDGVIDEWCQHCLTCLIAQGLPTSIQAIQGLQDHPIKKRSDIKNSAKKSMEKWFPEMKLHSLDSIQDGGILLRQIANQKQKSIYYRSHRPYLLALDAKFEENEESNGFGTLKVSGYLRGSPLNVNGIVYLSGFGEYQMSQIDLPSDPHALRKSKQKNTGMDIDEGVEMEEDLKVLARSDPSKQFSLVGEAEVDPMDAEQTWPGEDELKEADENARKSKLMGDASMIMDAIQEDDDDEDDWEDMEDSDDDDGYGDFAEGDMEASDDEEGAESDSEFVEGSVADSNINTDRYDDQLDLEEESRQFDKYKEERENEMFPDEMDTPQDINARERFLRYRGLKSFRTSPWDCKEALPLDYARVFQFQNFEFSKKRAMKRNTDDDTAAQVGSYITLHISKFPKSFYENMSGNKKPLSVFGLLEHEQRMTVMHHVLKRHQTFTEPVKAKERLTFHVGYRSFTACPIFSQHTTGNKFKMERFLPYDDVVMATVYAPVTFPKCPVVVMNENEEIVATGMVHKADPNRVVVKKIILSAHPYKINKKTVVARYMFFNRDDVLWFKPIELWTKHGRRGHIKDVLGTHGHMKCVFDGQLKAQDTICMNLYKRVFPKWTYSPLTPITCNKDAIDVDT